MSVTLTTKRGDTFARSWTFRDGNGLPIDLTGCTARAQIRDRSGEVIAEVTDGDGLTITPLDGIIETAYSAATMALVPVGRHETDVEITYPDGTVRSTPTVKIKIIEDITRD